MDKNRRIDRNDIRDGQSDFEYKKKYVGDNSRRIHDSNSVIMRRSNHFEKSTENGIHDRGNLFDSKRKASGARKVTSYQDRKPLQSTSNTYLNKQQKALEIANGRRKRAIEQRKKQRQFKIRLTAALVFILCVLVAVILVFMTPVFNIKQIKLQGNNIVPKSEIEEKVGYLVGENIFKSNKSEIENKILEISKINDVTVKKHYIPPSLTLDIVESMPAAYLLSGNTIVIINSDLKIIDDSNTFDTTNIPSLSGVSVQSYKLNETLHTDSNEKEDILRVLLKALENDGILSGVTYISLDDLTDIRFNYGNRIEVLCGSQLELSRKIRMFTQAISSSSLDSNARGKMDLSVPGQAVYTP